MSKNSIISKDASNNDIVVNNGTLAIRQEGCKFENNNQILDVEIDNLEELEAARCLTEEERNPILVSWQRIERNAHDWRMWTKGLNSASKKDQSWDAQGRQLRGR